MKALLAIITGMTLFVAEAEVQPVWTSAQLAAPKEILQEVVTPKGLVLPGKAPLSVERAAGMPAETKTLSLTAWVRPTAFERYNEIFRVESEKGRLLFSFQENGAILSLGILAQYYAECDAPYPPLAMDGCWHFAAATFDRGVATVYVDGEKILSKKFGAETALLDTSKAGFVGSNCGGENFIGGLDDLRLYSAALSQEELKAMMAAAKPRVDAANAKVPAAEREKAFRQILPILRARVGALQEFMPITDLQWAACSDAERRQWQDIKELGGAVTKLLDAPDALSSAKITELLAKFKALPPVPERPYVSEAVAPYVAPNTPEPRRYSKEEAERALVEDWTRQAGEKPDPAKELRRTRKLAERLGADTVALDKLGAALNEEKTPALEAYLRIRRVKRAMMLANPVYSFDNLLLVDMPYPQGSEWMHETRHQLGYMGIPGGQLLVVDAKRLDGEVRRIMPQTPLSGSFWRPDVSYDGKRVLFCFKPANEKTFHIYEINADGTGLKQLTAGIFDDLDPIYLPDGKHYVFTSTRGYCYVRCMPPTNAFSLMRGLFGSDDLYFISANNEPDYEPSVMNDGRIIFTRWEYTDKPLWRMEKLWSVNPDGTQQNTFWGNQSARPDLMKDARSIPGSRRLMFTGSAHHNWFSGSVGIIDPTKGFNYPHGLTKITAECDWPEIGNGPDKQAIESPDYEAYGYNIAYYSPYPLSEKDFLVSVLQKKGGNVWKLDSSMKFSLYLMDTDGNRELIYQGTNNVFYAMPLAVRPQPPVLHDRITMPTRAERENPKDGIFYSANVYHGAPEVLRGKARFLRILYIEQKTYTYWNHRPGLSTGPVVSLIQTDGVKRILGEAPIAADGSVCFQAPAGVSLHFQLLDANHRCLQTMRSFANVQPGESRGCLGCHESHSRAPALGKPISEITAHPSAITPVPWAFDKEFLFAPADCTSLDEAAKIGPEKAKSASAETRRNVHRYGTAIGFKRDIQPVLDRYCGKCHEGDGKARKKVDLTPKPWQPYALLVGYPGWGAKDVIFWGRPADLEVPKIDLKNPPPGYDLAGTWKVENFSTGDPSAYVTFPPMVKMSYTSPLVKIAAGEIPHKGVKMDPCSLLRIILWVDAMCPYLTDADIREEPDPEFQGSDWLSQKPRLKSAPIVVRPGPYSARADLDTVLREYSFK